MAFFPDLAAPRFRSISMNSGLIPSLISEIADWIWADDMVDTFWSFWPEIVKSSGLGGVSRVGLGAGAGFGLEEGLGGWGRAAPREPRGMSNPISLLGGSWKTVFGTAEFCERGTKS